MNFKIGISGKRDLNEQDHIEVRKAIKNFIEVILALNDNAKIIGVSSLASGSDSIFADLIVNTFNWPLEVVLPFDKDEYEKDFSKVDKQIFRTLIEAASKVIVLGGSIEDDTKRKNSYLSAGIQIVNEVQEMIFVWDEQPPKGRGGTADILGYFFFLKNCKPKYIIDLKPKKEDPIISDLNTEFSLSDSAAKSQKKKHDTIWQQTLLISWLAVFFFSIKVGFEIKEFYGLILVYLEFLLLVSVGVLVFYGHHQKVHHHFLKSRVRAEQLRLLRCLYKMGFDTQIPMLIDRNDDNLKKLLDAATGPKYVPDNQPIYYSRMIFEEMMNEQIDYHSDKIVIIANAPEKFENLQLAVGVFFL